MISLVFQSVKSLPAMWETWVQSLGWEDPLEKEMAIHSSILAWKIPWREETAASAAAKLLHLCPTLCDPKDRSPPGSSPEKVMAPHSSTLAWKIPWMEELGRLQSMGSLRVGHD